MASVEVDGAGTLQVPDTVDKGEFRKSYKDDGVLMIDLDGGSPGVAILGDQASFAGQEDGGQDTIIKAGGEVIAQIREGIQPGEIEPMGMPVVGYEQLDLSTRVTEGEKGLRMLIGGCQNGLLRVKER